MGIEDRLTSSQRGKIAELHVATALMAQSGGRLSPFEPLSDDHGVDLVVVDKVSGNALPIQVKSWFLAPERPVKTVQFDLQKSTYTIDGRGAAICALMDPDTLAIIMSWMIPLSDIPNVATEQPKKYAMVPSRMENSRDKYVPYRHTNIASLTRAVEALLSD